MSRAISVFQALHFSALVCVLSALPALAQDSKATPPNAAAEDEYRIGPGDVLQLFVWKEPDLTRDVTVRFDGKVTVPLLGDVQAAGHPPQELADDIAKRLARFLAAPQVTVGVIQANSARFHVLGLVGKPGDFPLTRRTSVLQGLALAGGFKEFAKTERILIIRREGDAQTSILVNYKALEMGKDLSQDVVLKPGDTILVP